MRASDETEEVWLGIEQPGGSVTHRSTRVYTAGHPLAPASYRECERLLKFLLWSRGGCRVYMAGPGPLRTFLRHHYAEAPTGVFDANVMGAQVYGREFELVEAGHSDFPRLREATTRLGRHLDGFRIGFDLGASDRKVAAVANGEVLFSEEVPWDPARHADPQWHYDEIMDSLQRAAAHLPRVDAIGGSAAGVYVDNEVRIASIFRAVPPEAFAARVHGLFRELRRAWGGIPFVVVNDGDVTALAGAMMAGVGSLLGVALGSSEAAGYVTPGGSLTSWLNELAFAPIDLAPDGPIDEWSGDRGCGAQYLSQQALRRLLPRAGIEVDPEMSAPDQLIALQGLMQSGDPRAARVYETIGVFLGYALLRYASFYEIRHVLLLGRVMSGPGGDTIAERARAVMRAEDPIVADGITIHMAAERDRRHGQAVAAASLPELKPAAGG